MSDLRTLLHEAAGPPAAAPTSEFTDAVLALGHRALRRRRIRVLSAGSGLVTAAVLAMVLAFSMVGQSGVASTQLVAYTGKQPVGFTLDKVPEDWHIQFANSGYLLLAPNDMKGVSRDRQDLEGKVSVALQLNVPELTGAKVQVNGRPGVVFNNAPLDYTDEPQGRTLYVQQPTRRMVLPPCTTDMKKAIKRYDLDLKVYPCGTAVRTPYLAIQVPGDLGWTNDQLVDFATGIHITKDSTVSN